MADIDALYQQIYGGGQGSPAPGGGSVNWERSVARLNALADQYKVPRNLVHAVVKHESNWDPYAEGDGGQAKGWFQLHAGAAKDAGIDPRFRHEPALNMLGGVRYLALKLTQAGGDEDKALRLYNGGGDPNYVANVRRHMGRDQSPPPPQSSGRLARVSTALSPRSAEAASPSPARSSIDDLYQQIYGSAVPQPAPAQPAASQPPPATTPPPPETATPALLERFDRLPAVQTWSAADRAARRQEFAALTPDLQEEFLRSEEPASQVTVDIEKTSPPARPWREGDPIPHQYRPQVTPSQVEPALEEGITKPSTMIPLLMPGAGLKALPEALRYGTGFAARAARPIVEGLSQTLGWGTGRTIETGQVPSAGELATEAGMNIAVGGAFEALHAGVQQRLRRSQAGRAIVAADEQTRTAYQTFEQEVAAAKQAQQQGQQELYEEGLLKAKVAQREYQMTLAERQKVIAANQQEYETALTAYQQTEAAKQAAYQGKVAQQAADVAAQGQAIQTARAVPGRYSPQTPSWVLYEKFGDAAKDSVVDLTPAKAALAEVRASRGVLPDGTVRPFPAAVEKIATALEKAEGAASVQTIRNELRALGPLTRAADGNIRGPAKQLYGLYADALEASPLANDLLRQANATFRREMALQDVREWLRPGHGVIKIDRQGRETINVGALLTKLEKTIGDDTQFARSFTPEDLTALRQDFGRLAGTPTMPTRTLTPPTAGTPPTAPAEPARPALPADVRVPQLEAPALPPAPATVTPRQALGARPPFAGPRAGTWGAILATMTAMGVPAPVTATTAAIGALHVTQRQARWLMAHYLLSPTKRPLVQAALDNRMRLNPRTYGVMVHLLSPEEKKQYQRETR